MTNDETYFGTPERRAAFIKAIDLACNAKDCGTCPIGEICCQPIDKVFKWLSTECPEDDPNSR